MNHHQLAPIPQPWSKQHKQVTKAGTGGLPYPYMSNSFVQPVTIPELLEWSRQAGDEDLVQEYLQHDLHYTANGGSPDVRHAIAETMYGDEITADHIIVTPGAQVALQLVHRAICHTNMHAITFAPGYQSVVEGPALAGAGHVTQINLSDNHMQLDDHVVQTQVIPALQPTTSYMVLNQPYNPAGTLMAPSTHAQLIQLAHQHDLYILSDEVYRLLEHDPTTPRLPAMADAYDKGISVVTLSKPWGACGTTLGWIACRDMPLVHAIRDHHQYFGTACMARASELQAMMVLRHCDRIIERALTVIRRNKTRLQQFIDTYQEWFAWVAPPTAGAIGAVRFLGPHSSQALGQLLAEQAGIGIKPAYCFQAMDSIVPEHDFFRVGFGEVNMPEALQALERFVLAHQEEWRTIMQQRQQQQTAT